MGFVLSARRRSVLLLALAVSACGSDDDPSLPSEPAPQLTAPRLRAPLNHAYVGSVRAPASLAPTFSWQPVDGAALATFYEVQVSTDAGFARAVITFTTEENQVKPMLELPVSREPPVGRRYYWRVRSCDGVSCSPYSPGRVLNLGRSDHDVNGDGLADVLAYAPLGIGASVVRVNVYLGAETPTFDAVPDGTFLGSATGEIFNVQVASAGDFNGDGFADVVVGAPSLDRATGAAYVFFGGPDVRFGAEPDLVLHGAAPDGRFGEAVAGAGDLDGDGFGDLVVSAPGVDGQGAAYLYLGSPNGGLPTRTVTLRDPRCTSCVGFGIAVAPAGDFDGDGYDDVALTVNAGRGNARVYFGDATATFGSSAELNGGGLNGIAGGGDVDGDGYADVVTTGFGDAISGAAKLYFGGPDHSRYNVGTVTYSELNTGFGEQVAMPGDVDGDGFADILVGADQRYLRSTGGAYLYAGGPRSTLATLAFSHVVGSVEMASLDNRWRVGAAGDVNGDGFADLVIRDMPAAASHSDLVGSTFLYAGGSRLALDAPAYGTLRAEP